MSHSASADLPDDLKARLAAAGVTDEESLQRTLAADPALAADLAAFLAERQAEAARQAFAAFLAESPPDLKARLAAAGVTDEESLQRALAADPALAADLAAFLAERSAQLQPQQVAQLLATLLTIPDRNALIRFWNQVPLELEDAFLAAVDAEIAQAEQAGAADRAAALRERGDDLRRVLAEQEQEFALLQRALAALIQAGDDQLPELWNTIPLELEDAFLALADAQAGAAEQAGDAGVAARLRERVPALRQLQANQRAFRDMPPTQRALLQFLQAASDDDARSVFAERRDLLQPYEMQSLLDQLAREAPAEQRDRLAARRDLLLLLRGVVEQPATGQLHDHPAAPTFENQRLTVGGNLNQAGGSIYINSAHVEGSGSAVVINNIHLERRWSRPTPPPLPRPMIERAGELQQVQALLAQNQAVTISGQSTLAVQGMPGIGKTTLANQLALALDADFPDGVIWQPIGPEIQAPEQVQPLLNQWARYALLVPPEQTAALQFDSSAVRALLAERPRLLVLLDNVWSLEAIRPLREALPPGARLVITTRLQTVMVGLGGARHILGMLAEDDARKLIALRLGWSAVPPEHQPWCDALAAGVGHHTLALDVALGLLLLEGDAPDAWRESAAQIIAHLRAGQGFADLHIPEGDREHNIERVLAYSYARMEPGAQRRFRLLGAVAPNADFATAMAAQLWECDEPTAHRHLNRDLVNAALLSRAGAGRWRQHGLLRGYALALLRRTGEYEAAAAHYAAIYDDAMRVADDAQRFAPMLPDMPHLRHAFAWAIENDLRRTQSLIGNSANLQAAFGLDREQLSWSEAALAAARRRGTPADLARAHGSLGNALQRIATLAGEDRRARLLAALAAYDEALRFRTPESAPLAYAMTQNNRANLLSDIATLAGEDRRARLLAALAAYDEALRFYTPESAPLDYAMTQNNRATLLSEIATLAGEDRRARLLAALAAYDEALRFRTPESAPLAYASTQNNRATLLSAIATLAGEDRRARLLAALAAYDEALRFYTPESAPLAYASTQNNRANRLSDIATLAGEDRRARLLAALAAYDEALRFYTPESAPLDYAMTQNNRATLLSAIATLAGEDRRARLLAALAAYDEALRFRTPESAPLAYASTQNNRANLLSDIATLAGEDRRARLLAALAAYDEALRFRTPESAPLDYAMTQNNRATLLSAIATLAGEDRRARLLAALAAYDEALRFYTPESAPLDYAMTQNNRATLLSAIATLAGEDRRARLLAALAAYDEALRFYTPESAPLDYAMTQNNRATLLSAIATLAGEDRRARLLAALAAYDEALRFYTPESAPLDYAMTQNNRATLLSAIATLAGEDRRARLLAALAAYDEALRFRTPESAPLAYASTQNNRANRLSDIATLAGEDRRARLLAALAAYDEALRFYTPESAPLDYAMTQNNRATLLSAIATLAGEDRRARLLAALAAYDEALRFRTPESAPLAYAMTQNNRATLLSAIATLAGEDRRARLLAALAAYDEALRFRTPESAPLDYAMTQGNLLNLHQAMAELPGEARQARLVDAFRAGWIAFRLFGQLQHGYYQQQAARQLRQLHSACGEDFATLWAELHAGPPPAWLLQPDQPASPSLPAALQARLDAAGATDEASLQRALDADPELRRALEAYIAANQPQPDQDPLARLLAEFLAVADAPALVAFWQQLPAELEEPFLATAEQALARAEQAEQSDLAEALQQRLEGLRQIQAAQRAAPVSPEQQALQQALERYLALRQAAEADVQNGAAWQAAVAAGEALLAPEFAALDGINWPALHANLAGAYTSLSIAHEHTPDLLASLVATDRAIALQPDVAMWHRNRAGTLISLGRFDEAAAALEQARTLEPDAPRLAELDQQLADAHTAPPATAEEP